MAESTLTLEEVETAIRDILKTGVSYSRTGFARTSANLPDLMKLRDQLIREAKIAKGNLSFISDFSTGIGTTEADEFGDI